MKSVMTRGIFTTIMGTLKEVNNYYPYGGLMGGGTVGNETITLEQDGDMRLSGGRMIINKNLISQKGASDKRFENHQLSLIEMISLVATHEAEHLTNPEASTELAGKEKAEKTAIDRENSALDEITKKHNEK